MRAPVLSLERVAAALIGAAAFAIVLARAWTWPIAHDEALTWLRYARDAATIYAPPFDANNHVLYSLLEAVLVRVLPSEPIVLRLPAVVAAACFLFCAARLVSGCVASRPLRMLVFAVIAWNPLVLDFLTAARGYGPGLAAFTLAALDVLRAGQAPDARSASRRMLRAGGLTGVAIAFNLAYLYGAVGLALAAVANRPAASARARVLRVVPGAALAVLIAGTICGPALVHARPESFYAGAARLASGLDSLVTGSFVADVNASPWGGRAQRVAALLPMLRGLAAFWLVLALVPLLADAWAGKRGGAARADRPCAAPGAWVVVGTVAAAALNHAAFDAPWFEDRTGLVFLVFVPLAAGGAPDLLRGRVRAFARVVVAVAAIPLCLSFGAQAATARAFHVWPFDADARAVDAALAALPLADRADGVAVDWRMLPALRFLRDARGERGVGGEDPPDPYVSLQDPGRARVVVTHVRLAGDVPRGLDLDPLTRFPHGAVLARRRGMR